MDDRDNRASQQGAAPQPLSRRGFLTFSAAAAAAGVALPLLNACAPPTQSPAPAGTPQSAAKPAAGSGTTPAAKAFPSYIPFTGGPTPDFSDPDPLFSQAFENFPAQTFKANQTPPGSGGTVNALVTAYFPSPTPYDQNPTWQAINKALNTEMRMNIIPGADYRVKFATTMSDNDLPDIMHVFFGYTVAPNLPAFFKSRCADLTPYLSGDAAKEYPYLAAIPTHSWRNSLSVVDGALYLIPIHRQMFSIQPRGGNFFTNVDMWDPEIGANTLPKSADDFKRILTQLNRPNENRWAIGNTGTNDNLFGLGAYASMFGAPNNWKLDASGKLIKDRETEEYKAAVGFTRELFAAGLFHPDSPTFSRSRESFVGRKFAVSVEGQGNSWVDFWQQGQVMNPPTRFKMLTPWHADANQKPMQFLGTGFVSMNVLKKAPPERIKEILRILNWLASPFGSEEALMLSYGLKDQDYTLDEKGNPKPTTEGVARAGYVPWRYLSQHPWVTYQAGLTGFAKASYDAEKATIPIGIDDPTNGYYAAAQYSKGNVADIAFNDGVRAIQLGQRPFSDYDSLVQEWRTAAGDQIRQEYTEAISAAKA